MRDEERPEPRRGSCRPSRDGDLRPSVLARQLQLPDRLAVLDAAAKRDASAGERTRGRVMVRRGEDAKLEWLTSERRQLKIGRRLELELTFESLRLNTHALINGN